MSTGNPLEARHPIRGLETGDAIAWTLVTGETVARGGFENIVRNTMLQARGTSDVLVVAIPHGRREAVMRSMKRGTT